jgi:hypothetical protein
MPAKTGWVGSPDQPRDDHGRFTAGSWASVKSGESKIGEARARVAGAGGPYKQESPKEFKQAFDAAFAGSPFKDHVTHYTEEQLAGMKLYASADGKAGVAVHDHGDGRVEATALFNGGGAKGAGLGLLDHVMRVAGVNYVECYGPRLNTLYAPLGFKVDSKSRFNKQYAAKTWDFKRFDSPNYYAMKL